MNFFYLTIPIVIFSSDEYIVNNSVFFRCADYFICHVGGDFIVIFEDSSKLVLFGREVIKRLDSVVAKYYSKEDLDKGFIETYNREGVFLKNFLNISIVVFEYKDFFENSANEICADIIRAKRKAKKLNDVSSNNNEELWDFKRIMIY